MRTQNSTYQTILVTFVVALVSFIIGLMLSNVIRDIFFYSPAVAPLATRSVASPTLIRAHKAAEPLTKMAINIPLTAALVIPVDQAWASDEVAATVDEVSKIVPQGTYSDLIVFVLGSIPFLWATWEFWRRIAVGAPFGTGSDSVVFPSEATIGEDGNPRSSRGRQVLGQGAMLAAYSIFTVVGITVVVCGVFVYQAFTQAPTLS
mmetsp:Transcript_10906/g.19414  ORF Transcript_10906/g.19414 Transcript_10906/m.19414 type:complete len:205 (-) Transcript_10906:1487-2101(-)